jgi:predicted amidophosphoribosyltransferase
MMTPDERCADETHRWGALREVLRQRESVVVVCPMPGRGSFPGCATLALDFHKVAEVAERFPFPATERFRLTESAKRLHQAKYEDSTAEVRSIARELASIIASHAVYEKAGMIAVVSGRKHDCSIRLGNEVGNLTGKTRVTLATRNRQDTGPKFVLMSPDSVKDEEVIIVDDVYRTGDNMRYAAQVLRGAGARQVLGLTVTCAVSAIIPQ